MKLRCWCIHSSNFLLYYIYIYIYICYIYCIYILWNQIVADIFLAVLWLNCWVRFQCLFKFCWNVFICSKCIRFSSRVVCWSCCLGCLKVRGETFRPVKFLTRCRVGRNTQKNIFEILLDQPEIRLYLLFSDWLGTKLTSVWF